MTIMKSPGRIAAWCLALCAMAVLAGCASGPRVSTEVDPEADFSRYRTFAFYSPLAIERDGYGSARSDRMKLAARAQMEARGYVYAEDAPDVWVNINAFTELRTDVHSMPTVDYAYYYNYRANRYYAVPYWRERADVYRYTEGTMNIDIVDVERNRLVWEGIAVGRVTSAKDPVKRDAQIDEAVAAVFSNYPYRAGQVPPPQ